MMRKSSICLALLLVAGTVPVAFADDKLSADTKVSSEKTIRMDEPMTTEMMKPGMMKGDVKSIAEKKDKATKPMMEMEEKSMPRDKGKP